MTQLNLEIAYSLRFYAGGVLSEMFATNMNLQSNSSYYSSSARKVIANAIEDAKNAEKNAGKITFNACVFSG